MKTNKLTIFNKIDSFVFQQVEKLINHPNYREALAKLDVLSDEQIKVVNQILSYFIITLPILLASILLVYLQISKNKLDQTLSIKTLIEKMETQKKSVKSLEFALISPVKSTSKSELQGQLAGILTRYNIDSSKIKVENFESMASKSSISTIKAKIRFNSFSSQNFSDFLNLLAINRKFKIESIEVKKTKDGKQLFGEIEVKFFSKF